MRSRGAISDCPRGPRPPQDSFLSSAPDAAVVSKSDARHFAGNFAADSEPSRGTESRKRVKTHPKDQSGLSPGGGSPGDQDSNRPASSTEASGGVRKEAVAELAVHGMK